MWLKLVVGVGKLINSVDLYILLDLVGVGDWKVPTVVWGLNRLHCLSDWPIALARLGPIECKVASLLLLCIRQREIQKYSMKNTQW